jgi:hypothetical protein
MLEKQKGKKQTGRKLCTNHLTDKGLLFRIYKEFYVFQLKDK